MWENRSFRKCNGTSSGRSKLNSTMPILPSSPMIARQRTSVNTNGNISAGAGPLLSTPFMPQIKRALGLEPKVQKNYSEHRRHSFGFGMSPVSPTVIPGSLPHVRLNKTRRLSISERNCSMLNKSNTVKIAPPVLGKVTSPSLYHMRCNTSLQEDRSTPDTYAIISALKERRKRSINAFDEHAAEGPIQQAKRRRQESQHSNASTSSMPSMPENFPDLSSADFTMRLETPGVKRPSRPSQEDVEEWEHESTKRPSCEGRNNCILSSLSSSQRFIENQKTKRKVDWSFGEEEIDCYSSKHQRRDEPPKLTHLDISYISNHATKTPAVPQMEKSLQQSNGHSVVTSQKEDSHEKLPSNNELPEYPAVRKMPCMKKTTSIYSGLSSPDRFKKVQYANVFATLDDYDSDREAEQERVQQMLKDLDESFTTKKGVTTTSTPTLSTLTAIVAMTTAASVSLGTTATTPVAISVPKTTSVLSVLEKLAKSPIQESGGQSVSAASTQPSVASTQPSVASTQPSMAFTQPSVVSTQPSLISTQPSVASTQPSVAYTQPSVASTQPSMASTQPSVAFTQPSVASTQPSVAFTQPSVVSTQPSLISTQPSVAYTQPSVAYTQPSVSFKPLFAMPGSSQSTANSGLQDPTTLTGSTTGAANGNSSSTSQAAVTAGIQTSLTGTNTLSPGGFSFNLPSGLAVPTSSAAAPVLPVGTPVSSSSVAQPSSGVGFSFGATTTTTAALVPQANPGSGIGFNMGGASSIATAAPVAGFNFGGAPSTAAVMPTVVSTATTASGFGLGSVTASAPMAAGGFGFNPAAAPTSSAVPATFAFGSQPASIASGNTSGTTGGFSFGGPPSAAAATVAAVQFGTVSTASAPTFNFGGATSAGPAGVFGTNTAPAPQSQFAFAAKPNTSSVTSPFGAQASSTAQSPFGTPSSTSTPTPFGASVGNTAPALNFGATKPPVSAAPFAFNVGSTVSSAGTTPLQTGTSSTPASAGLFQFGGSATTSTPAFGTTTTQSGSVFGTANQIPAFGSANQTPTFGANSQTPTFGSANQVPAFGTDNKPPPYASTNQNQGFGTANPAPTFGSTSQAPAFGSTNQQSPAFGVANPMPAFGSATPTFGASANQKPSTPVFGATATNPSGSMFGSTGNTPAGFAKSHSMPVFATNMDNANNAGTFNFGGPAPNVNPFCQGQTTPAKQTGTAFGQIANDSTPKSQTGGLFAFGQTNNISTVAKGFDFSSSAAPAPATNPAGYNFSATSVPDFGAAGATPGAFALGVGTTAPRQPRTVARTQRRRPPRR